MRGAGAASFPLNARFKLCCEEKSAESRCRSVPRWSRKTECVIGASLFSGKQPTLKFNGYETELAALYAGTDLRKNF